MMYNAFILELYIEYWFHLQNFFDVVQYTDL
jgi:hypothetical protein